jgi:DNA topoisomerase I
MAKAKTDLIKLVIVESPAKARKIGGYLGDGYVVEASVGHIRDLPQRAADIPKEFKKIAWAKEGVDIENDFAPLYVINPDKKAKVAELKELMKNAEELILATDEDREGEAIAWHLVEVLEPKIPIKRMVFNEITKEAIQAAVEDTRDLDYHLNRCARNSSRIRPSITVTDFLQFCGRKLCHVFQQVVCNQLQHV